MRISKDRMYRDLSPLKNLFNVDLNGKSGLKSRDNDRLVLVTGRTGIGKSTFLLHMFELWYGEILKKPITADLIDYLGSNGKEFMHAFYLADKKRRKYYMIADDEAVKSAYSGDSLSKFSKALKKMFDVIRGLNLYTVLLVPNILTLDKYFREDRINYLIHIYKLGHYAVFSKKRVNQILKKLASQPKGTNILSLDVEPNFVGRFKKYDGILKEAYDKRKQDNMRQSVREVYAEFAVNNDDEKLRNGVKPKYIQVAKQVEKHFRNGMSVAEIERSVLLYGKKVSRPTIEGAIRYIRKKDKVNASLGIN